MKINAFTFLTKKNFKTFLGIDYLLKNNTSIGLVA